MRSLLILGLLGVGIYLFVGRQARHDPMAHVDVSTPDGYALARIEHKLTFELDDGSEDPSHAGWLYLRGAVANKGDRRLSDVVLRIEYAKKSGDRPRTTLKRLGPFAPRQTRKIDELFEAIWGQETRDPEVLLYEYHWTIEVEKVVFAGS